MNRLAAFLLTLSRQLFWIIAFGLILAAFYVSLGRQLVPLVAEYRAEVQQKAQAALGMPITLGRLEGRWEGFAPRLLAHDVLLGEGDSAMRLDRIAIVPDLAGSLWAREWRLSRLELSGVQLSVAEDAEGKWRVEGLPTRTEQKPPEPQKMLESLQRVRGLVVRNSQITLEPIGESPLTLSYTDLSLRVDGERLRVDGRSILPDGQPLALNIQGRVQPQRWQHAEAQVYLSLPQSDWAAWLPRRLTADWHLQTLKMGGELWVSLREQALERAVLRLNASQLSISFADREPVQLEDLGGEAYIDRNEQGYRLLLDRLAFDLDGERWGDARIQLQQDQAQQHWRLQADRLAIAPIATLVRALAPLPPIAAETLTALQPNGTLRNLQLDYYPQMESPQRLQFAANLDRISIAAQNWIPAVGNASGSIRGDLGGGALRVDSDDFSLQLAPLYPEPWHYRHAGGRLTWALDEQAFTLAAPYLRIDGEEGKIAGDFLIRLARDPAAEDYMDLRVGLSEGDARFTEKYLPTRSPALSPALVSWLREAIRGGTVEQGYFQYQGALNKGASDSARALSLYFKVRDAELAFQPGWPLLQQGRGEVLIEDSGVRVRLAEGRILDSQVRDATAEIPRAGAGNVPQLAVKGQVDSSLADALTLLQEAPIGTAELFAGWQGQGALSGTLDLQIPLGKGTPRVIVDFASDDARLKIPEPALAFEQLRGKFRYDTARGLSAEAIQARLFGSSVKGKAVATGAPGKPASRLEAQGTVGLQRLVEWLAIGQSLPASGELPYQLRLDLAGEDSQLQIDSSLQGLRIDLPAPFGKSAGERRDTSLRMSLQGAERHYGVQHGALAALAFAAPPGAWAQGRGELRLGPGAANLPARAGLYVRGRLPELDLKAWQAVLEQHGKADAQQTTGSLLRRAQVDIGRFDGFGTRIDDLGLDLRRLSDAWDLGLRSSTIGGSVRLPDAEGGTIVADLQHLRLPAPAQTGEAASKDRPDPLADVDPQSLPAMDVAIKRISLGDDVLGAWALKLRPVSAGIEFRDIALDLKGLKITGSGGWDGAQTWYKGRLEGRNLADVLLAWGFAPSVTSDSFRLDVDGRWPGSPAWFAMARYSGSMQPRLRKGQFVEVDGSAQALRVFGVLNFNSIGRRLRLDFSDLFSKGLSYDRLDGRLLAKEGVFNTREPITVSGPSTNLELDGTLDMARDQIDAKLLVTLPISNNLPLAALIVGAPAIGGALFVVDKLLGDRVARFASVQYDVKGPWQSPKISFDKPFEKPN
ncbi:YhdP family protein [Stutzerimonas frequens]|uniref:YhdP family protein n=1 Tax=Stutzerimonas frequens TaxID=2968969 RepID=UPI002552F46A|nr:YhdP family protein [Stutzerimonas frequens]MDL0441194.1 YhdP family protein [Stutzerimonas frequens]